jgi:hypothetical protein
MEVSLAKQAQITRLKQTLLFTKDWSNRLTKKMSNFVFLIDANKTPYYEIQGLDDMAYLSCI